METQDQIITFETFYDPMLAHIVRARLEDNGIACFIADENMIGINPLYNNALGGIKLKIFERDLERCRAILSPDEMIPIDEHDYIDEETGVITLCPYCGSSNTRHGSATEKRFGWLSILVSLLLSVYPISTRKAWHCFKCGCDFE